MLFRSAESPLHRTETVDVGVVLEGETWLPGPREYFDQVLG